MRKPEIAELHANVEAWQNETDCYEKEKLFESVLRKFAPGITYDSMKYSGGFVRGYDREDLEQCCRVALYWAMVSWRPNKGQFNTYGWTCIHNELLSLKEKSSIREAAWEEAAWDQEVLAETVVANPTGEEVDGGVRVLLMDFESLDLTPRQLRVVQGLLLGREKQEIAKAEGVSPMTITWDVKALAKHESVRELLHVQ